MGFIDVSGLRYVLGDGRVLFDDVSFRVADGSKTALIGPNGAGKTTLLRLIAGDLAPQAGTIASRGGVGVMRQFIGSIRDGSTVRDLLVAVAPPAIRAARRALDESEAALLTDDGTEAAVANAQAIADWAEAGGYDIEVVWNLCTQAALGQSYEEAWARPVVELSGGEQKRLALESLLRGPDEVLLLDEPDNYLDVAGKEWLEEALVQTRKTVLYVTHDRELLARTAERAITIEGGVAWTHGGGFAGYAQARRDRHERQEELHRRWDEEHERLRTYVRTLQQQAARSADMASRYKAAQSRLARFEAEGPPPAPPREQDVRMRLRGARTGVQVLVCEGLAIPGMVQPFDLDVFYGERVAVVGPNGSGKSHFLRLLGGGEVAHTGRWRLGARVVPGSFSQLHHRPDLDRPPPRRRPPRPRARPRRRHQGAAPLRARRPGRPGVHHALRRPAGALPDPAPRARRRHAPPPRRAHRQPRPGERPGARGRPRRLRRHGHRGDARPLVRALVRPLPRLRSRRLSDASRTRPHGERWRRRRADLAADAREGVEGACEAVLT